MKTRFLPYTALTLCLGLASLSLPGFVNAEGESAWHFFKGSASRLGIAQESVDLPFEISWKYTHEGKSNGFVDWGPVAANGIVYTGNGLNGVLAMNSKTGEIVWQKDLISNIFSVSLSEDNSILYVTTAITTKPTPTLFAINPKNGDVLWDNMTQNQPAVGGMEGAPAIADGKIFSGYLQYEGHGGVAAYDSKTGKLLWHWETERVSPYSPVAYADGLLYIGFENKSLYCLNAENGKVQWSQPTTDLPYAAPLVFDKKVYIGAGNTIYSMDARTGQIMWQKTFEAQFGHTSLSAFEKTLYIASRESKVFALTASEGNVVWTQDLKKGAIESSAIVDANKKMLYIATQENWLLALSLKDGDVKGEIQLSQDERGVWKSAPALYEGRLYIGSLDKTFYALE